MKIFFHCSAVSCKLKVSFIWFACNLRKLPDAWFFHASGKLQKIQKWSFFHNFWAHSIKQMMHKFYLRVGRTCVHAVPLNFVRNPLGCASWVQTIQRYLVYTISYRPAKTCASFAYCHTLPDSVNGRLTDINVREENYPVVNVVYGF